MQERAVRVRDLFLGFIHFLQLGYSGYIFWNKWNIKRLPVFLFMNFALRKTMVTTAGSFDQTKESMKAPWTVGNLDVLTKILGAKAAQEFVDRLPLTIGSRMLDVACGTGWSTIPLARRGMVVTGVDMIPSLLAQARQNARQEKVSIQFDEGYAEQLPYPDAEFDGLITMFGAMFSPHPEMVVAELERVLKPAGLLAMANWSERSFSGQMASITGRYLKPPPGIVSPLLWGNETVVRERLAPSFQSIRTEIISIEWELPMSSTEAANFFREHSGRLQIMFERLDARGQSALASELEQHWAKSNIASDANRHTIIKNEYLQVTGFRR